MKLAQKARARVTWRELEAMNNMARSDAGWLPYRGFHSPTKRLVACGLAQECGMAAMPPHVLYVLTDAGKSLLNQINR